MEDQLKMHWEDVYKTRSSDQLSWTETKPEHSLSMIRNTELAKNSPVIDIGGGDSLLVDYLLKDGYSDITVLDISAEAIEKAKKRLGGNSEKVTWIVNDILDFKYDRQFAIWHDRATFHFLTNFDQKDRYKHLVENAVGGSHMILGTFSLSGPQNCSGLPVYQYDIASLTDVFKDSFELKSHFYADHRTPFNTTQNFLFADFIRTNI